MKKVIAACLSAAIVVGSVSLISASAKTVKAGDKGFITAILAVIARIANSGS